MPREKTAVLVLYNAPAEDGLHPGVACAESDAGVLEAVTGVATALKRLGHPCRVAAVRTMRDLTELVARAPEPVVFNLVEALVGEPDASPYVPAVCAAHGKGCTGGDTLTLCLTMDKWRTKGLLREAGLPVPDAVLVRPGGKVPARGLPRGRLIVKPVAADASEGIDTHSVCAGPGAQLRRLVGDIHRQFGQPALIEKFIDGRELNVSVWQRGDEVIVLPLAEIDFSNYDPRLPRMVGYRAKWLPGTPEYHGTPRLLPAPLPARLAARVRQVARAAWEACGCQDCARVDFRVSARGEPFVLEVNVNPDVSPGAGFPAALKAGGTRYATFIATLVANAEARRRAEAASLARGTVATPAPARAAPVAPGTAVIRHSIDADRGPVIDLLVATGFFRPDEIEVATEVIDDALEAGPGGHYQSFVAEDAHGVAGWVCLGEVPCSLGAWDVYWLGVAPDRQGQGIGKALVRHAEELILARGGRLSVIETSGSSGYGSTRGFYLACGYDETACIADFYARGDDRIIYTKRLRD